MPGYVDYQFLQFTNITGAATTVVKTGLGRFLGIQVNGGTLTGVITIWDNTAGSGTLIGTIAQPQVAGQFYRYQTLVRTGLTIKTAAAVDITVCADHD